MTHISLFCWLEYSIRFSGRPWENWTLPTISHTTAARQFKGQQTFAPDHQMGKDSTARATFTPPSTLKSGVIVDEEKELL